MSMHIAGKEWKVLKFSQHPKCQQYFGGFFLSFLCTFFSLEEDIVSFRFSVSFFNSVIISMTMQFKKQN